VLPQVAFLLLPIIFLLLLTTCRINCNSSCVSGIVLASIKFSQTQHLKITLRNEPLLPTMVAISCMSFKPTFLQQRSAKAMEKTVPYGVFISISTQRTLKPLTNWLSFKNKITVKKLK
jgi:hypothetical protein